MSLHPPAPDATGDPATNPESAIPTPTTFLRAPKPCRINPVSGHHAPAHLAPPPSLPRYPTPPSAESMAATAPPAPPMLSHTGSEATPRTAGDGSGHHRHARAAQPPSRWIHAAPTLSRRAAAGSRPRRLSHVALPPSSGPGRPSFPPQPAICRSNQEALGPIQPRLS
ncbi:hypothetical protein VPH35_130182 [Triticum aestivum]